MRCKQIREGEAKIKAFKRKLEIQTLRGSGHKHFEREIEM